MCSIRSTINYSKLPLRYVICVDVKSFFASVEAVRRGIDPMEAFIVVLSGLDRPGGIVLASSPMIKKVFGIKTGNRKFEIPNDPRIMIVPPSMGLYVRKNREINAIFGRFAAEEDILTYSIDESFLDLTATAHLFGDPMTMAVKIKEAVKKELGLPVTIGIGDNPLLAKLALDNDAKHQPNQIAYWNYAGIPDTVWRIPKLIDFWGISRGWERRLNSMGIFSVCELAHSNPQSLEGAFGIIGMQQYYHANGVDYSRISERVPAKSKSYSKGQVLMRDYSGRHEILIILHEMVDEVAARLRKHHVRCIVAGLSIGASKDRLGSFSVDRKLSRPSNLTHELIIVFEELFLAHWRGEPVRQIYVNCVLAKSSTEESQLRLFAPQDDMRWLRLDQAVDSIHDRFGRTSVFRATALLPASTYLARSGYVGGHQGYSEVPHAVA
jgi:DNA polymerase V